MHSSQLPEFTDLIVSSVRDMKIGPTCDPGANPTMGPLYSRKAVDKFLRFQTMAKRESQKTVKWGKAVETSSGGFFVSPGIHILSGPESNSAYQRNVLLFPDIAIYEYDNISSAVEGVNCTDAPLVVSVLTQDVEAVRSLRFCSPNVAINLPTVELEAQLPVAGRGPCGSVRHNGVGMVENLTRPASVAVATAGDAGSYLKVWPGIG